MSSDTKPVPPTKPIEPTKPALPTKPRSSFKQTCIATVGKWGPLAACTQTVSLWIDLFIWLSRLQDGLRIFCTVRHILECHKEIVNWATGHDLVYGNVKPANMVAKSEDCRQWEFGRNRIKIRNSQLLWHWDNLSIIESLYMWMLCCVYVCRYINKFLNIKLNVSLLFIREIRTTILYYIVWFCFVFKAKPTTNSIGK